MKSHVIVLHKKGGDNSPFWDEKKDAEDRAAKLSEGVTSNFDTVGEFQFLCRAWQDQAGAAHRAAKREVRVCASSVSVSQLFRRARLSAVAVSKC